MTRGQMFYKEHSELPEKLGDHLVSNAHRIVSFPE